MWMGGVRKNPAPVPPPPPPTPPGPPPGPAPPSPPVETGPLSRTFDDSNWTIVDVPHDFIISGQYDQSQPGSGSSYLPRKNSYYRKHFNLPDDYKGQAVWLYFDGVFQTAQVYLNGELLGFQECGYTSFYYRLDNVSTVKFGDGPENENVVALYVDGSKGSGWWYEGAGIYRHVHLYITSKQHIELDGVFAPGTVSGKITSGDAPTDGHSADVTVNCSLVAVNDDSTSSVSLSARYTLVDPKTNGVVGHTTVPAISLPKAPSSGATTSQYLNGTISLTAANLWSIPRPYLYTLISELLSASGDVVDATNTTVGFRSLHYTADQGFFMNDAHVKVRGFCDHASFGGVGAAVPDRILLFRAQTMRSIGGNGRRMSHNPPEPAALDIYDRVGGVVMDENRVFGSALNLVNNMGAMVKRDRNHPSITIWSFCNEGACGASNGTGFRDVTYQYDGTRPVLGNDDGNLALNKNMDVQGFSHKSGSTFDNYHSINPDKPTFASECCSCQTMRDEPDEFNGGCVAGQTNQSNGRPYVSGTMVWTLFDYYGESHGWPHVISEYGQFDVVGFAKAAAHWYRSWWLGAVPETSDDRPVVGGAHAAHIVEMWDGNATMVATNGDDTRNIHGYTNAPYANLLVNGKSQGAQAVSDLGAASWTVPFTPGNLTLVALDEHNMTLATDTRITPGVAAKVELSIDTPTPTLGTGSALFADGQDVALLRATIVDAKGNKVGSSAANVTFTIVSGPGRVIASHNGDQGNHEPNHAPWHSAFHGLVRGIVQVTVDAATPTWHRRRMLQIDTDANRRTTIVNPDGVSDPPPDIVVQATSPGLTSSTVTIPVSVDPAAAVMATAYASVGKEITFN